MTATEARGISLENNTDIGSIIDEIKRCAFEGKTQTGFIECSFDCESLLEGMGYSVFRKGFEEVQIGW